MSVVDSSDASAQTDPNRPVLSLRDVSKRFGMVQAVAELSLDLHAGEVVSLVGDNGAGKSTLVGMISGTLDPDGGEILVDGVPVTFEDPAHARDVGIETVFQNLSLIPTLDITENVFLNRERYYGNPLTRALRFMDRRQMQIEVGEVYQRLGLDLPAPRTKVAALSGGQRQAVAIARAVKWGGHIVLLDEPAAALGVKQTEIVLSLIERLRQHHIAVIFISHNMDHVLRVADRVVVMRLGHKVADKSKQDVTSTDLVHLITSAEIPAESVS